MSIQHHGSLFLALAGLLAHSVPATADDKKLIKSAASG